MDRREKQGKKRLKWKKKLSTKVFHSFKYIINHANFALSTSSFYTPGLIHYMTWIVRAKGRLEAQILLLQVNNYGTPPPFPFRAQKLLILITLDRCKRHFWEKNYIKNYFYLLKKTKSNKTTSQKCWRNIIWVDFFGHPYCTNSTQSAKKSLNTSLHISIAVAVEDQLSFKRRLLSKIKGSTN